MKAKHLLAALGLLAGCAKSPTQAADTIRSYYSSSVFRPPRKYEPLELRAIAPAPRAKALPGEQWFYHRYVATDSAGRSSVVIDTVTVEPDGRVSFHSTTLGK